MNSIEYYNCQKEDWRYDEVNTLKYEYETQQLTVSEIADIHRRTPGSISYKLKNIGLITCNTLARGFLDYKNSDLYKQIVETGKKRYNVENNINKDAKIKEKTEGLKQRIRNRDILDEMRNEIMDLKKNVKEMLRLMNALYDFESQ